MHRCFYADKPLVHSLDNYCKRNYLRGMNLRDFATIGYLVHHISNFYIVALVIIKVIFTTLLFVDKTEMQITRKYV